MEEKGDGRARRGEPVADLRRDRQDGGPAVQRLTDDVGEEARRGQVRRARPDADGGQADGDAVDEAASRVVAQQELDHRLLGAVTGRRRGGMVIGDDVGHRRTEHGDRRAEDQAGMVVRAGEADRLQEVPGRVEVHAVPLFEIALGLARDHRRQVDDDVGSRRDQISGDAGVGEVGGDGVLAAGDVGARQRAERLGPQRPVPGQSLGELSPQHPRRSDDQDPHREQ